MIGGATSPGARRRLPLVVWVLGAVAFLMGTSELIVVGLLPQFAATFSVPTADAGLLVTVFAVGMMLGAPVMSLATLRMSRRTALIAALLAFAAAQIVIAVSVVFPLTLVARFVAAAANGTFWAVGAVVATAAVGAGSSARALSVMVSGFTLANVVGAPLGTVLGLALGWPGPFLVLAVLALAATALVVRQVPGDPPARTDIRSAVRSETAVLKRPSMWLIYAATALIPGGLLATYSYVAPLLIERAHLPSAAVPLGLLAYGLGSLAGVVLAGRWGDHRPLLVLVAAVGVLVAVQVAMALWGDDGPLTIALLVVLGAAGLIVNPVLVALVVRATDGGKTLAVALSTSAFNLGIALGSALGGVALSGALGLQGPPIVGSVLTALALLPLAGLAWSGRRGAPALLGRTVGEPPVPRDAGDIRRSADDDRSRMHHIPARGPDPRTGRGSGR
ncbi:MFS transporter [Amnibacterium sp.]|uniref:MFS transporter n=1 Tax=Amnibacterium sp. TaxID=1872496 RepID=UPI0026065251|nr:MFS transporter [Amnibacterium sp.]MCU1474826.1 transporter [Amnibacterium sp.]